MEQRGFLTMATGKDEYYVLAKNLLLSYRHFAKKPLPFAIICDRENEITALFDKVIIIENPTNSYMDKLEIFAKDVFKETIWLDADSLVYDDINTAFDVFKDASFVSAFGEVLPKNSDDAWFNCEKIKFSGGGVLPDYSLLFHGGLMYIRNDREKLDEFYNTTKVVAKNYYDYNFKLFTKPADEPIIAFAMANHGCKPVCWNKEIGFFYIRKSNVVCDFIKGKVFWKRLGTKNTYWAKEKQKGVAKICHFGTSTTRLPLYKMQIDILNLLISENLKEAKKQNGKCLKYQKQTNFKDRLRPILRKIRGWISKR